MQHTRFSILLLGSLCLAMGCGDDGGGGNVDASTGDPNADAFVDEDGFTAIVTREWSVTAGNENYQCARITLDRDIYIGGFRALDPTGTHHTVLTVNQTPRGGDGPYSCTSASLGHSMLFASGIGTDDLLFPEGVAIKVEAGQQLDLNLHLFNLTESSISGVSGSMVKLISEAEVQQEAEVVFGGKQPFTVPFDPGNPDQVISGGCEFDRDATVIALWPHMHQIGRNIQVTHRTSVGATTTLLDEPFDFDEQLNYILPEPVQVAAGDRFDIDCTFRNDTGGSVFWGESSNNEMCYVGIYRYPKPPGLGQNILGCVE